ncbi:transketolase [Edwardsiella piscicida]|uniref:Transketolase (TK) n=1 Tax=Edwardsiella tarda (strain FL6-60) TaxID=718251 RepID=A0A0H3DTJ1_EDWTF|nr:Transketolase (TK) [Edwardsiella tarda FL6-60]
MDITAMRRMTRQIRADIVRMIYQAGSGHPGGSLSAVEIVTALYFGGVMRVDPARPDDAERDRFILSKGHCAPVLYSALCRRGFFEPRHLDTLRRLDSILQGHPHASAVPGVDCSSGSLGQGLSIANGIAMGLRRQGIKRRVYCLLGDGELQEGQVWEAALSAAHYGLSNVCAIVDNNHVQLDGATAEVKGVEPVADKWRAFGWNVLCVEGHSLSALLQALRGAAREPVRPSVIIADTVKGKGVSFMEHQAHWHGQAPDAVQLAQALDEIQAYQERDPGGRDE